MPGIGRGAGEDRRPGQSFPLGAAPGHGGVNFSVFADRAEGVELLLFERVDDPRPARECEHGVNASRVGTTGVGAPTYAQPIGQGA